jgi:CheY-like chemotaxis protein
MSHIVICDDDPQVCRLLVRALADHGDEVTVTTTVPECHRSVRQGAPDLLLTDLLLQGENTLALIRQLRADFRTLKIVAITGAGRLWAHAAVQQGADCVLEKPFIMESLTELVQTLLPHEISPREQRSTS